MIHQNGGFSVTPSASSAVTRIPEPKGIRYVLKMPLGWPVLPIRCVPQGAAVSSNPTPCPSPSSMSIDGTFSPSTEIRIRVLR